ncbi:MAG TPA: Rieske 2Fe-2S domain-containing protein [Polyangia bacterium]|nr:Rieske 2Fe-2S domain-containing protein [Polyangia bacterium]
MRSRTTTPPGSPDASVEDSRAAVKPEAGWTFALHADDLWEGEMVGVVCGGTDVLVARLDAEVRAYENRCPHAGSRLSDGFLEAAKLTCSAHRWEFDLQTGAGINPVRCRLRRFPVKIIDGDILIQL